MKQSQTVGALDRFCNMAFGQELTSFQKDYLNTVPKKARVKRNNIVGANSYHSIIDDI